MRPALADAMSTAMPMSPAAGPAVARGGLGPVVVGEALCRLDVWSDAEWASLPAEYRPTLAVHAPGMGWVVAVPA
jgi:hypothetical protein